MASKTGHLDDLRDALDHLYDPHRLQRNPLVELLDVANRTNKAAALQDILIESIESLKPNTGAPPQSRAWRIYDLLFYRYVQQFTQQEVADQLGLSVRHLRREQQAALETLAAQLEAKYGLEKHEQQEQPATQSAAIPESESSVVWAAELAWLKEAPPEQPADLRSILSTTLDLIRPLVEQRNVQLTAKLPDALPPIAAHPIGVRQTLLSVLNAVMRDVADGRMAVSAGIKQWGVEVRVEYMGSGTARSTHAQGEEDSFAVAQELANLCGGLLTTLDQQSGFTATLSFPALGQFPVLAIDDNPDTLELLQRYVSGSRYRLLTTQDLENAFKLAQSCAPQIIVLDVMMPHIDGWEALGRLREHPLTRDAPVIVCTILAQEELALALGAAAFVQKPVTREAFLAALDHQVAQREKELR